jgi:hypothetical protein
MLLIKFGAFNCLVEAGLWEIISIVPSLIAMLVSPLPLYTLRHSNEFCEISF